MITQTEQMNKSDAVLSVLRWDIEAAHRELSTLYAMGASQREIERQRAQLERYQEYLRIEMNLSETARADALAAERETSMTLLYDGTYRVTRNGHPLGFVRQIDGTTGWYWRPVGQSAWRTGSRTSNDAWDALIDATDGGTR